MEVDHDKQVVYTETLALALHEPDLLLAAMQPSEEHVAGRLTSPIVSTHLDTRNIAFERWAGTPRAAHGGGEVWGRSSRDGAGCEKGKETLVQEDEQHMRRFLHGRNKSGIWGWRSEKMEVVSGYEAKVGTGTWGGQQGHGGAMGH